MSTFSQNRLQEKHVRVVKWALVGLGMYCNILYCSAVRVRFLDGSPLYNEVIVYSRLKRENRS
jgi:hypothetical protein